jgi:hypothetical protein
LAAKAMGWLGWSPEQTMAADINIVRMALDSKIDLLQKVYGSGKDKRKAIPVTNENLRAIAKSHNDNWRQSNGRR